MDEKLMLPLKRVELSLTKFNEVAIPHHLDLLRQHKANILKYEECSEWARVRSEQTHARRVVSQLRSLLAEMEALRSQVAPQDHARFDALTQRSRDLTLKAIVDYLGIIEGSCMSIVNAAKKQLHETSPLSMNRRGQSEAGSPAQVAGSARSTDSVGMVAHTELEQLHLHEQESVVRSREAVLHGWCELQQEVHALHETWQHMHTLASQQKEHVEQSAASVQVAADNVEGGRRQLLLAERWKTGAVGAWGAGGAVLGALAGGPVGLVVGAKAGAAALLAGSAVGYWAARLLACRRLHQLEGHTHTQPPTDCADDRKNK